MPKTLQLLKSSRFLFNVHHDYAGDSFDFRPHFRFDFQLNHPSPPQAEGRREVLLVDHGCLGARLGAERAGELALELEQPLRDEGLEGRAGAIAKIFPATKGRHPIPDQ